jgi:hypothetical protein
MGLMGSGGVACCDGNTNKVTPTLSSDLHTLCNKVAVRESGFFASIVSAGQWGEPFCGLRGMTRTCFDIGDRKPPAGAPKHGPRAR